MPGVVFSDDAADRIADAVRWVESHQGSRQIPRAGQPSTSAGTEIITVQVTGAVDGNGNYPAVPTLWNPDTSAWVDYDPVNLKPANGQTLVSGTRYECRPAGLSPDGVTPLYTTCDSPGGGGSLTMLDVTATMVVHTYPNVTTIKVYETDGLFLTQPLPSTNPGLIELHLSVATPSGAGSVSVFDQTFAGLKHFTNGIDLPTAPTTSAALHSQLINWSFGNDSDYYPSIGLGGYGVSSVHYPILLGTFWDQTTGPPPIQTWPWVGLGVTDESWGLESPGNVMIIGRDGVPGILICTWDGVSGFSTLSFGITGSAGGITFTSGIATGTTSERRFKDGITAITGALATVQRLQGRTYTWNAGYMQYMHQAPPSGAQHGLIVDEIEPVCPDLIVRWPAKRQGALRTDPPETVKGVDYARLTPILIEAIKELAAQVADLQSRVPLH